MYLSRLPLDVKRRSTIQLLSSPSKIHGAVESCFESKDKRRLWRIDPLNDRLYLMVLSAEKPEYAYMIAKYAIKDETPEFVDYEKLLNRIESGEKYHFRLCANPVISVNDVKECKIKKTRGKLHAHLTPKHQKQWLIDRAGKNGFSLKEEEFDVQSDTNHHFRKKAGNKVFIKKVCFEGVLTVENADLIKNTLVLGLGRAKAYGCGMLTLARIR